MPAGWVSAVLMPVLSLEQGVCSSTVAGDLPAVQGKNLTVRQRLEQHRNSALCASCHARLDPFGIALEN